MQESNQPQVEVVEDAAVSASINMVDGVVTIAAKIDIVQAIKIKAKESDNTMDDYLATMVEMAQSGLDWKGYAKSIL